MPRDVTLVMRYCAESAITLYTLHHVLAHELYTKGFWELIQGGTPEAIFHAHTFAPRYCFKLFFLHDTCDELFHLNFGCCSRLSSCHQSVLTKFILTTATCSLIERSPSYVDRMSMQYCYHIRVMSASFHRKRTWKILVNCFYNQWIPDLLTTYTCNALNRKVKIFMSGCNLGTGGSLIKSDLILQKQYM